MSLTRKALDKWMEVARQDIESAPADGMLQYLIEQQFGKQPPLLPEHQRAVEIVAYAYYKAMVEYTRA